MVDDSAFNLRFVETIERNPCLYDYTRSDYVKRDANDRAWKDVSKEMNITVAQAKEKWRNLRTALTRSMKIKTKQSPGRGLVLSRQNKEYYLKDAMQFILPFLKFKGSPDYESFVGVNEPEIVYESSSDHGNELESCSSELDPNQFEDFSPVQCPPSLMKNPSKRPYEAVESDDDSKERFGSLEPPKKLVSHADRNPSASHWSNHRESPGLVTILPPDDNPDLLFLKSLLPDLSKMSDYQKRQFKRRTLDVIDSILCDSSQPNSLTMNVPKGPNEEGCKILHPSNHKKPSSTTTVSENIGPVPGSTRIQCDSPESSSFTTKWPEVSDEGCKILYPTNYKKTSSITKTVGTGPNDGCKVQLIIPSNLNEHFTVKMEPTSEE